MASHLHLIPLLEECDDLTILFIFGNSGNKIVRKRRKHFDFNSLSSQFCVDNFRFSKDDILRLKSALRIPPFLRHGNGLIVNGTEALCILLKRMAYPNRLIDLVSFFGRPNCEIGRIFNMTVEFIIQRHGHLLRTLRHNFLNPETLDYLSKCVFQKGAPYRTCFGFVDGTVRPICRPEKGQREFYNGHKRTHALKFQSVMLPNGIIASMYGPVNGRRHDAHILAESNIMEELERDFVSEDGRPYFLYGDPAYPLREHLIVPFKGQLLSRPQRACNKIMSSVRESVEWGFGKIMQNWAFLDYKKNLKIGIQPVANYYLVGTLLTNCHTCLYGSQVSDYFSCEPPTLEEYLSI